MKPNLARVLAEGFRARMNNAHTISFYCKTPSQYSAWKAGYYHADRLMK